MNIRKIIATLVIAVLMVGMAGNSFQNISDSGCVYAAEKPAYLKSVTYFGTEWPINYWGSEDENLDENLVQIQADGFNSIILVIPWREFQPMDGKQEFNQQAFDKLHNVITCAEKHGLWVTLRIGYTWDYYGPSGVPSRFLEVTQKDSAARGMWLRYSKELYQAASSHGNFHSAFITWEDFWDYVQMMGSSLSKAERVKMAQTCGYTEYLKKHYSLEKVNEIYANENFSSFEEIGIPERNDPAAALFFEYYDWFLNEFLAETQTVFPGISMEIRVDGDLVHTSDGMYYYSHSATYPCHGADYSALMYSVSMGQKNEYDRISADRALQATDRNLAVFSALSEKRLYVEQLLYMDTTAEFSYNTQIAEEEVDDYVRGLAPILPKSTMGYGLWVYRNYVNNCVYNGQFGLDLTGWDCSGQAAVRTIDGNRKAVLRKNDTISQQLAGRLGDTKEIQVEFWAEPTAGRTKLEVSLGGHIKPVTVDQTGIYTLSFPWNGKYDLKLQADGAVMLDDIKVYTYEQYGRIYGAHGEEQDLAEDFRVLNSLLP